MNTQTTSEFATFLASDWDGEVPDLLELKSSEDGPGEALNLVTVRLYAPPSNPGGPSPIRLLDLLDISSFGTVLLVRMLWVAGGEEDHQLQIVWLQDLSTADDDFDLNSALLWGRLSQVMDRDLVANSTVRISDHLRLLLTE